MQKVYLLLRNNQQTGPYSLEELISYGLKQDDLIWVEGKSVSWAFPHEMDTLKAYVPLGSHNNINSTKEEGIKEEHYNYFPKADPSSKASSDKKVFVSFPYTPYPSTDEAKDRKSSTLPHQKTEEPQWAPPAYSQPSKTDAPNIPIQNNYSRSLAEVEESYTNWMYQQKTKGRRKISSKVWALLSIALLLLVVGFLIGKDLFPNGEMQTTSSPSQQRITKESLPATNEPIAVSAEKQKDPSLTVAKGSLFPANNHIASHEVKSQIKTKSTAKPNAENAIKDQPAIATENKERPSVTVINNDSNTQTTPQKNESAEVSEKKKKFGERINDFFDKLKHKKEEDQPSSQGNKENTIPNSGERKATHRGDEAPTVTENENLMELVDITANEPQDNWMLGIRGLKITLRNRSDETIKTAVVEVNYYSEDNKLLQTRKLQFTNVAPKKSATIAAPDHPLADHTDCHLLSATD